MNWLRKQLQGIRLRFSRAPGRVAQELGVPKSTARIVISDVVQAICDEASPPADGPGILTKALARLDMFDEFAEPTAHEKRTMDLYVSRLPEREREILMLHENDLKHAQIAKQMDMTVDAVRASLVAIYSGLRMYMRGSDEALPEQARAERETA